MTVVRIVILLQLLTLLATSAAAARVTVTIEAPTVQRTTATFDYFGVETFDTASLGRHSSPYVSHFGGISGISGTYTGLDIRPRDTSGGAHGIGQYPVAMNFATYSVAFTQSGTAGINYFGYWLSALDEGNQLKIFSPTGLIFELAPKDILSLVGNNTAYLGNPTFSPRVNMNEPYVFLNFFCNDCLISRIEFRQTTAFGYESDNHTVGFFKTQSGTEVPVKTTTTTRATTATTRTTTATTRTTTATTRTTTATTRTTTITTKPTTTTTTITTKPTTTTTTTKPTTTTTTTSTMTTPTTTIMTTPTVTITKEGTPVISTTGVPPIGEGGKLGGGALAGIGAAAAGGVAVAAGVMYRALKSAPKPESLEGDFMDDTNIELAEDRDQMADAGMI